MPRSKILEMHSITKTFPGVKALDNVSFDVYENEILALVGENGAGKSTLMKVLSGSYPAGTYTGDIIVNGKKMIFKNSAQSEAVGIAMIYQEISMHLQMSVAENIFLGRWPGLKGKINWKKMNEETVKYLAMVNLKISPTEKLGNLGASQQQLVSIARALSKNPKILVLDEPTSPLTLTESENLFNILHKLKKNGTSSILISHKLDEVFENSDRITVLRDGKTISTSNIENADQHKIISDMVGREIDEMYPKEKVKIGDVIFELKDFTVPHPYIENKNIVEDISLNLRKGEVLGIAGLVGTGRSETMNAVFGKMQKKSGKVFIEGKEVNIKSPIDAIKSGIALVTEERKTDGIIGIHSIKDNSILVSLKELFPSGIINLKKAFNAADKYYKKMNIKAPNMDTLVQQLSGGNQQKVVLAKWLMKKPKVLILDEPTRGIDVGAKAEIYKIMMDIVKQGSSIIMISSELPELMSMSDRIVVLANGHVSGEKIINESVTQEDIMKLAVGGI